MNCASNEYLQSMKTEINNMNTAIKIHTPSRLYIFTLLFLSFINASFAQPGDWRQKYDFTGRFIHGQVVVQLDGRYGLCDSVGHEILECNYTSIEIMPEGYVLFKTENEGAGWMTPDHKILFAPNEDEESDEPANYATDIQLSPYGFLEVNNGQYRALYTYSGKQIIPFILNNEVEWADEYDSDYGYGLISGDSGVGLIDSNGKIVFPMEYCSIINLETPNKWIICKNAKYGIINKAGKYLITAIYDALESFSHYRFVAKKGNKKGLLDSTGSILFPFEYTEIYLVPGGQIRSNLGNFDLEPYMQLYKDGKSSICRSSNLQVIIPLKYDRIDQVDNGLFRVYKNKLVGFADTSGNEIITPQFDYADYFYNRPYTVVRKGELCGIIDLKGNLLLPYKYNGIGFGSNYHNIINNGKWGLMDTFFREVVPPLYDERIEYFPGKAKRNGFYGLIGKNGKEITDFIYDYVWCSYITDDSTRLIQVVKNQKTGLISQSGKIYFEPVFDQIFSDNGVFFYVIKNKLYGYIGPGGAWLIPCIYEDLKHVHEGMFAVKKNGKYALLDSTTYSVKTAFRFENIREFYEGLIAVERAGKWGYANRKGDIAIPYKWQMTFGFHEGRSCVMMDKKWGFIDLRGILVIPTLYDNCEYFDDGKVFIRKNGKRMYLDKFGKDLEGI